MKLYFVIGFLLAGFTAQADFLPHQPEACPNMTGKFLAHATSGAYEVSVSQQRLDNGDTKFRFMANGMDFSLLANGVLRIWDERDGGTGELNLCNAGAFHAYWIRKGKLDGHSTYYFNEQGELLHHSVDSFGDKTYPWDRISN